MVKKVWQTDRQTDGQTDWTSHIAAWSQLKIIKQLFYVTSSFMHQFVAICGFKLELQSVSLNSGQNGKFSSPCDLEVWQMTLKNNRAPLLCHFKICASFYSHQWIQTGVAVWKCSNQVKIGNFLSCVTLKFDELHRKTIGLLLYATLSFMQYFIHIGEFKLETPESCQNWQFFVMYDLEIWQMTLKNNRAPLLS